MNLEQLEALFGWMTVINVGIMILSAVMFAALKSLVYKLHGRLFELSKDQLGALIYGYLGLYKVLIIVFNLVPFLALKLVQ